MKKIKIFCTLGPSTLNKKFLRFAQRNRIDLVRLNMSHLSAKNLEKNIKFIKANSNLNICIDTEGAQIRTKTEKKILLQKNQKLIIFRHKKIHFYPEEVFHKLKKNDILEIGFDGLIIKVTKKLKDRIQANCIRGGTLEKNKGVHLSNRNINLSFLTSKDFAAIKLGKKYKIKNYALSFTNTCNDILKFSKLLPFENKIYKIETNKAVKNFNSLNKVANDFLIDRGDLSKEISIEKIPKTQRLIFKKKRKKTNIFIATNLLESMIEKPYPTRAEANDIYNAIEMGASGLVLAAETAIGKFPVECINFLKKITSQFKKN
tara:strand:- start:1260 stop:2213 length:954 start_codon:yes stop_codon:yes gene_type:complete